MQCQKSGSTLKRRDTGRQLCWGVEPHLHKIRQKKQKFLRKLCHGGTQNGHKQKCPGSYAMARHSQQHGTNKSALGDKWSPGIHNKQKNVTAPRETSHSQAFGTHTKTLQQKHKDKQWQTKEAPTQILPQKATHNTTEEQKGQCWEHYGNVWLLLWSSQLGSL